MEEVIAALLYMYIISRARDYFEKWFETSLLVLEEGVEEDKTAQNHERICAYS
mgnify:CR=1 FL=1